MAKTKARAGRPITVRRNDEFLRRIASLEKDNEHLRRLLADRDNALFHIREYITARAAPPYLPPRTRSKDEAQLLVDALAARRLQSSVAGQRLRDALSRSRGERSTEVARLLTELLRAHNGNLASVARDMDTSRSQLHRLCHRHGVDLMAQPSRLTSGRGRRGS